MLKFLAFLIGEWVFIPYSWAIRRLLILKGIHVGPGFRIQGVPKIRIAGRPGAIRIGKRVTFTGDVDLRNRENGAISIGDGCRIDHGVRMIAARDATLSIGSESEIGLYSVLNCGANVSIGKKCMFSGFTYIQSTNHGSKKGIPIKEQTQEYGPIQIGDDVWLGSHASILMGVTIGDGVIVGAKSVVTKDLPANSIAVGVPAQVRGERS